MIPPAFGLAGVNKTTFTGDGDDVAYGNRYVSVTQMGGHGTFTDPRIGVCVTNGTPASLEAVVRAYDARRSLRLTEAQIADLVQYLKSL